MGMSSTIKPLTKINKEFSVIIHIVLDKYGVLGVDTNNIKTDFLAANAAFKPIEASFRICEFRFIRNFNYNDTLKEEYHKVIYDKYLIENRINVFYIEEFFPRNTACGKASLGGVTKSNNVGVFIKKVGCRASTVIHELGHYFNLEHTFEKKNGAELVNGSNCATAGDGLCDTPADPYIHPSNAALYVNTNCNFIFQSKDANGDYYDPDVSNIMSYYGNCVCLTFTHDQFEKMANYYLSNPIKW